MAVTMVTLSVQAFIEHEDYDDEDLWVEGYQKKLDALSKKLSDYGTVDIVSEDPWD